MRTISVGLNNALQADCTTLATLWQVTRTDGTVLRFTDAAIPIVWNGNKFRSDVSFQASAMYLSISQNAAQTLSVLFMLDDTGIKEYDIRSRVYDLASADVYLIDYTTPANGTLHIGTWLFSKIVISDKGIAQVDLGPTSILGLSIGWQVYSPTCRATFGDARCTAPRTKGGPPSLALNPVSATNILTFQNLNPAINETVVIGTVGSPQTYTFKGTLTGAANEILIGTTVLATMNNLTNAINAKAGTGGYGFGTIANAFVTAINDGVSTMTVTAIVAGANGSNINTTETSTQLSWTTPQLAGGDDGLSVPFTVTALVSTSTFTSPQFVKPPSYFTQGFVRWLTGANAGTKFFIRSNSSTNLSLVAVPQVAIAVGDTGVAYPGCDKLPETCRDRWANEVNFRGEIAVPTQSILPAIPIISGIQIAGKA